MKNITTKFLSLILVLFVFAGCSFKNNDNISKTEIKKEPVKIEIKKVDYHSELQEDDFVDEYKDICKEDSEDILDDIGVVFCIEKVKSNLENYKVKSFDELIFLYSFNYKLIKYNSNEDSEDILDKYVNYRKNLFKFLSAKNKNEAISKFNKLNDLNKLIAISEVTKTHLNDQDISLKIDLKLNKAITKSIYKLYNTFVKQKDQQILKYSYANSTDYYIGYILLLNEKVEKLTNKKNNSIKELEYEYNKLSNFEKKLVISSIGDY